MDVRVDRVALDRGDLPEVCVVTGQPAIGLSEVRYSSMPSWAYLLGALPVMLLTQDLTAWLPVAEGVVERHARRLRWSRAGAAVLCVVVACTAVVLVAATASSAAREGDVQGVTDVVPWVIGTALAVGALAGLGINRSRTFVDLRPDHRTGEVRIIGAHPDFVAALEAATPVESSGGTRQERQG